MSETDIKRATIDALNATGLCLVWSTPSGHIQVRGGWMSLAPEGTPDVTGIARDGRFIGIEIKKPGGRTNKARADKQAKFQGHIARLGGISGQVESAAEAVTILLNAITIHNQKANT